MNRTVAAVEKVCDRLMSGILVALMLTLVLGVTWQVISRYVLMQPSSWTEELARFVLIWLGLLGTAYAYRTRAHMAIDQLVQRLGCRWRIRVQLVAMLAVILFAGAGMIVGGGKLVLLTLELDQLSAALGVRMGLVYLVLPVSGALLVFFAGLDVVKLLGKQSAASRGGD
jgi:TRAP-type C4-dicarboxylate transport system permease small subunit